MQILNCDNLISSCCSDYALAKSLSIFNKGIQFIHIFVPILLILITVINLMKLMSNPEEKKLIKQLKNKIVAAIIVFFIPTFINVILNLLPNSYDVYACMKVGDELDTMNRNNKIIYMATSDDKKVNVLNNPNDYEHGVPKKDKKDNTQDPITSGGGTILLIAGHSYPPYCSEGGLSDCRGASLRSGYAEEDETRKLVKLIKSNLENLGVKSDIANALLSGDNDKMNKSFYIESKRNTERFNKFDWNKYKFVLEVHFNATSGFEARGTLLCKNYSSYTTKADKEIVEAVTSHTGNKRLNDSIQTLNNVTYFTERNIPIVYLETEFYDNASAMKVYSNHINEIAHDIAVAIKKHYG